MKVAYLDCSSGVSGDMIIAAFIDAGFRIGDLKKTLSCVDITGYRISTERTTRHHITATKFNVGLTKENPTLKPEDIERIISSSKLNKRTKDLALKIFSCLLKAERKVHKSGNDVHLHELGSIDTIVDIVAVSTCLSSWQIDKVFFSNVTFGRRCPNAKTLLPIPSPATLEILKNVPARFSKVRSELITPTGAAVLHATGTYVGEPGLSVKKIGYGAGTRILQDTPNVLRLLVGTMEASYLKDRVIVVESSIDDTMPIVYTYLYSKLFEMGVLDAYSTNIYMKKNRPGILLTVILPPELLDEVSDLLFRETSTIGLRYYPVNRFKLARRSKAVSTSFGKVDVKISGTASSVYKVSPEFESCRRIAARKKVPFVKVYNAAKRALIIVVVLIVFPAGRSTGDIVYLKDGSAVKGIVVEVFKDRVNLSTEYGEAEIFKSEIRRIRYDLTEQNLVAMANACLDAGDFKDAYVYFSKASQVNPDYKNAIRGAAYVKNYLGAAGDYKEYQNVKHTSDIGTHPLSEKTRIKFNLKKTLGIEIGAASKNGEILVKMVYSNTPAERAGMKKGDIISELFGRLTRYTPIDEVALSLINPRTLEINIRIDRIIHVTKNALKPFQLNPEFDGWMLKPVNKENLVYHFGLRSGDVIRSVAGKSVRYSSISDITKILDNAEATEISIRRELVLRKDG